MKHNFKLDFESYSKNMLYSKTLLLEFESDDDYVALYQERRHLNSVMTNKVLYVGDDTLIDLQYCSSKLYYDPNNTEHEKILTYLFIHFFVPLRRTRKFGKCEWRSPHGDLRYQFKGDDIYAYNAQNFVDFYYCHNFGVIENLNSYYTLQTMLKDWNYLNFIVSEWENHIEEFLDSDIE